MHVLTIDTEHEPGSVAVVKTGDHEPDGQRTVAVLGSVGDPHSPHAQRHAEDLATDAGWLVSGGWELTTDAYAAPVTSATEAPAPCGVDDPLGLERCAVCTNAFAYEADEAATYRWRRSGRSGFVCRWCAPELDDILPPIDLPS